jgi:hypothetical protein
LKIDLIFYWPDHRKTVSILEKLLDHSPNPILLLDGVAVALLGLQCALQILLLTDRVSFGVQEPEAEVPHNPQEGGEVLLDLLGVAFSEGFRLYLEIF